MRNYIILGLLIMLFGAAFSSINITINSPANNSWVNISKPIINFTAVSNDSSTMNCTLFWWNSSTLTKVGTNDSVKNNTATTIPFNTSLQDGSWKYYLNCTNSSGTDHKATDNYTINVDTTPPSVSVISPTSNSYLNSKTISINFTATDTNFDYAYINITNGSSVNSTKVTTSGNQIVSLTVPSDGTYNISVTAYDKATNSNTSTSTNVVVDTTPPITNISTVNDDNTPYSPGSWTNKTVNITLSVIDVNPNVTYYKIDNGAWNQYTGQFNISSEGNHILQYYSIDKANNNESSIHTVHIKIDKTKPVLINPTTSSITFNNTVNLTFWINVSEELSGLNSAEVIINGSSSIPMHISTDKLKASYLLTDIGDINGILGPGLHIIKVFAIDNAGNPLTKVFNFTVESADISSINNSLAPVQFSVYNATTHKMINTSAFLPTIYNYDYGFSIGGFKVKIYNASINESEVAKIIDTNVSLNVTSIRDYVLNHTSNVTEISPVWVDLPWANVTDYSYGEVIMNDTYNAIYYCKALDNCTLIDKCNSTVNSSNYNNVIPTDGACYLNKNVTHVFVDHFSGVAGAKDGTPPTIQMKCSDKDVYLGNKLTCDVSISDNVMLSKVVCGGHEYLVNNVIFSKTFTMDTDVTGTHMFTCKAYDTSGNNATKSITYNVFSYPFSGSTNVTVNPSYKIIFDKVNGTIDIHPAIDIVREIKIDFNGEYTDVNIKVTKLINKPDVANPNGNVYSYFEINSNQNDSTINGASIYFKISKLWFAQNGFNESNVVLMRYHNNKWIKLKTTKTGEDDSYVYYSARTPGFSYYAITAFKSSQTQNTNQITNQTTNNATNVPPTNNQNVTQPNTPKVQPRTPNNTFNYIFIGSILSVLIIGFIIYIIKIYKKSKI